MTADFLSASKALLEALTRHWRDLAEPSTCNAQMGAWLIAQAACRIKSMLASCSSPTGLADAVGVHLIAVSIMPTIWTRAQCHLLASIPQALRASGQGASAVDLEAAPGSAGAS